MDPTAFDDDDATVAAISLGEGDRSKRISATFLDTIGAPGLARIEADFSLPASLPREIEFD